MTDETTTTTAAATQPRVRFGAIAWGLIVIAAATAVLLTLLRPAAREAIIDWMSRATGADVALVAVLACGGVLLVSGLVALARRVQSGRG